MDKKDLEAKEQELADKEAKLQLELDNMKKQQLEFSEKLAFNEAKTKIDTLIDEGRLTPNQASGLAEFIASLDDDSANLTFSENGEEKQLSNKDFMNIFLNKLPKQVEFSEITADSNNGNDLNANELASKAVAYKQQQEMLGNNISFSEAVTAIENGVLKDE